MVRKKSIQFVDLLMRSGQIVAIIDIDCAEVEGFDEEDEEGLVMLAELIAQSCDWRS